MARTGRPPVTRARVLNYWDKHGPCTIMQVCRVTGAERRHVQRLLRAAIQKGEIIAPENWGKPNLPNISGATQAKNANRRAALAGVIGHVTAQEIRSLVIASAGCALCGCEVGSNYQVDHKNPLSRGGPNLVSNLQIVCPPCNAAKADRILPHSEAA